MAAHADWVAATIYVRDEKGEVSEQRCVVTRQLGEDTTDVIECTDNWPSGTGRFPCGGNTNDICWLGALDVNAGEVAYLRSRRAGDNSEMTDQLVLYDPSTGDETVLLSEGTILVEASDTVQQVTFGAFRASGGRTEQSAVALTDFGVAVIGFIYEMGAGPCEGHYGGCPAVLFLDRDDFVDPSWEILLRDGTPNPVGDGNISYQPYFEIGGTGGGLAISAQAAVGTGSVPIESDHVFYMDDEGIRYVVSTGWTFEDFEYRSFTLPVASADYVAFAAEGGLATVYRGILLGKRAEDTFRFEHIVEPATEVEMLTAADRRTVRWPREPQLRQMNDGKEEYWHATRRFDLQRHCLTFNTTELDGPDEQPRQLECVYRACGRFGRVLSIDPDAGEPDLGADGFDLEVAYPEEESRGEVTLSGGDISNCAVVRRTAPSLFGVTLAFVLFGVVWWRRRAG